jgi:plasmid maintenance system antidote protein VapI
MKLDRMKVNLIMARNSLTISKLAKLYGVSRSRMNVILNSRQITTICAGRLANTLCVDVSDIVEE